MGELRYQIVSTIDGHVIYQTKDYVDACSVLYKIQLNDRFNGIFKDNRYTIITKFFEV